MPYPNEHSCRLQDPKKYSKFTRKNNAATVDGKPVHHIYGILSKKKSELQAIRYPTDSWDAGAARNHCKDEGGSFEKASGKEDARNIVEYMQSAPWAIYPPKLEAIQEAITKYKAEDIDSIEKTSNEETYLQINEDGIGVLSIMGILVLRPGWVEKWLLNAVDTEMLIRDLERAVESPDVKGLILHVDSPGGTTDGTRALADYIAMVKEVKPTVTYTDGMMASAAYWAGAAADKIYAYPTAQVGSVGVVAMHTDRSVLDEKIGIKRTYVYNGKYKRLIKDTEPLSEEGLEYIQELVDQIYHIFVKDVANFRGVDPKAILSHESKIFLADQAKKEKLVDDVLSFNQVYSILRRRCKLMDRSEFKADYGELYLQTKEEGLREATLNEIMEAHPDKVDIWIKQGMENERARISEIQGSAFHGQEELVKELISKGTSADESRKELIEDQKIRMQGNLQELRDSDPGNVGANSAEDPVEAHIEDTAKDKQEAGNKLDAVAKEIQAEETCSYSIAFNKAKAKHPKLYDIYMGK